MKYFFICVKQVWLYAK